MTHKEIYMELAKIAKIHRRLANELSDIEKEKFGFEFAETDSDQIIDTINYGIGNLKFEDYLKEMKFYKKSFDQNQGDLKANGTFVHKH